jgi:hypothetical protein
MNIMVHSINFDKMIDIIPKWNFHKYHYFQKDLMKLKAKKCINPKNSIRWDGFPPQVACAYGEKISQKMSVYEICQNVQQIANFIFLAIHHSSPRFFFGVFVAT